MSTGRDCHYDMLRQPLDDATMDALLAGRLAPEDAMAGYGPVATLIASATAAPSAEEVAGGPAVSQAAAALVAASRRGPAPEPVRRPRLSKLLTAKVAFAATVAAFGAGTAAAAATGSLPGQHPAHRRTPAGPAVTRVTGGSGGRSSGAHPPITGPPVSVPPATGGPSSSRAPKAPPASTIGLCRAPAFQDPINENGVARTRTHCRVAVAGATSTSYTTTTSPPTTVGEQGLLTVPAAGPLRPALSVPAQSAAGPAGKLPLVQTVTDHAANFAADQSSGRPVDTLHRPAPLPAPSVLPRG